MLLSESLVKKKKNRRAILKIGPTFRMETRKERVGVSFSFLMLPSHHAMLQPNQTNLPDDPDKIA